MAAASHGAERVQSTNTPAVVCGFRSVVSGCIRVPRTHPEGIGLPPENQLVVLQNDRTNTREGWVALEKGPRYPMSQQNSKRRNRVAEIIDGSLPGPSRSSWLAGCMFCSRSQARFLSAARRPPPRSGTATCPSRRQRGSCPAALPGCGALGSRPRRPAGKMSGTCRNQRSSCRSISAGPTATAYLMRSCLANAIIGVGSWCSCECRCLADAGWGAPIGCVDVASAGRAADGGGKVSTPDECGDAHTSFEVLTHKTKI